MHLHIPHRRPGAHADIIAVENVQLVMKEGKLFKTQIKEFANGARAGSGTAVGFFLQSVLDFGCAVGIMRQSRFLVGTGVGSWGLVAESREEGL